MTSIQLHLTPSPELPESLLDSALSDAARLKITPDKWVAQAFDSKLAASKAKRTSAKPSKKKGGK